MTVTAKELKALIAELGDDEQVVLRVRPAMSSLDEGKITLNRVKYVEIVQNVPHIPYRPERRDNRGKG